MNPWQMAQEVKHKLATAVWPTAAGDLVFGTRSVKVFAGTPTEEQIPPGFPWCMVGIGSGDPDDTHPELIEQTFNLVTGVDSKGDPMGEFAIIGGAAANLGRSVGRGIAEVAARVRAAVENLTGADGAPIILTATAIDTPSVFGTGRHLVVDSHTMTALCTSDLSYSAPQEIAVSGSSWTWAGGDLGGAGHCSGRFDFVQYRLVEKTGFVPSTGPTDGTVRATVTSAAATYTPVFANTYTVFADYSSRKQTGVVEGSSDPEVGSYLVVQ